MRQDRGNNFVFSFLNFMVFGIFLFPTLDIGSIFFGAPFPVFHFLLREIPVFHFFSYTILYFVFCVFTIWRMDLFRFIIAGWVLLNTAICFGVSTFIMMECGGIQDDCPPTVIRVFFDANTSNALLNTAIGQIIVTVCGLASFYLFKATPFRPSRGVD